MGRLKRFRRTCEFKTAKIEIASQCGQYGFGSTCQNVLFNSTNILVLPYS